MIFGAYLVTVIYIIYIIYLCYLKLLAEDGALNDQPRNISLIIPMRNERAHLDSLFHALEKLNYPKDKLEIVIIDDHSMDDTLQYCQKYAPNFPFKSRILQLEGGEFGKKRAIDLGVKSATFDYLVTTDADCVFHADWMTNISQSFTDSVEFSVGGVVRKGGGSAVEKFQFYESLFLLAITLTSKKNGPPLICTGANLAFRKKLYLELNPYEDNLHIPSGDDMFFLEAVQKTNYQTVIRSKREDLVYTEAKAKLKDMGRQVVRWIDKIDNLSNIELKYFSVLTLVINTFVLFLWFKSLLLSGIELSFIIIVTVKFCVDALFLWVNQQSVPEKVNYLWVLLLEVVYPVYLIWLLILKLRGENNWKGRSIN